ncbi:MRG-domain-containing protein [Amanita rubescens]|nr:MRG-domain-containing protein [Amanita rubescens]
MAATSASAANITISFNVGERVLCYHGPLIYEAKILKTENFTETTTTTGFFGPHYFVHYKGWKQTWDEWVPLNRLLAFNEENINKQKTLQQSAAASGALSAAKTHAAQKGTTGAGTREGGAGTRGSRKDGTRGTKRGREEDEGNKKPDIKVNVPEALKMFLVDDWESVTKNNQLVSLPRSPTVEEILDEYAEYVSSNKAKLTHLRDPQLVLPTIVSGLKCYFDRSLGANLLYRFERQQYADVRKQYITGPKVIVGQEKAMSAVYGAEHLLRMIVSLPQMIANSSLDAESVALVRDYVNELLQYILRERDHLLLKEYDNASLQYQNISRS